MLKLLLVLTFFAPFIFGKVLVDTENKEEKVEEENRLVPWVLTQEEYIGRHPCASDGICDCWVGEATMQLLVDCSNRNLTEPPKMYDKLHITKLDLSRNKLRQAPNMTEDGYKLVHNLDLSNNFIENITDNLISPSIKVLNLSNNKLSRIPESVLKLLLKKRVLWLWLEDNPWICDCETEALIEFIGRRFYILGVLLTTCADTKDMVLSKKYKDICPNGTSRYPIFKEY